MAKDLGTKHTCFKCGTKFYDMKRPAPVCPKCGTDQREVPAPARAGSERRKPAAARPEVEETDEELLDEADDEEDEDEDEDEDDA